MRTRPYEVEYTDGRVRVKRLSTEDAQSVSQQGDVADVRLPEDVPAGDPDAAEAEAAQRAAEEQAKREAEEEAEREAAEKAEAARVAAEAEAAQRAAKSAPRGRNKGRQPAANK